MVQLVYFSGDSGNTHRFVQSLGIEAMRIGDAEHRTPSRITEPFVLMTPTYGGGADYAAVPRPVRQFLARADNRARLRGVIGAGHRNFGFAFCLASRLIADQYGVPELYRVDGNGTDQDRERILTALTRALGSSARQSEPAVLARTPVAAAPHTLAIPIVVPRTTAEPVREPVREPVLAARFGPEPVVVSASEAVAPVPAPTPASAPAPAPALAAAFASPSQTPPLRRSRIRTGPTSVVADTPSTLPPAAPWREDEVMAQASNLAVPASSPAAAASNLAVPASSPAAQAPAAVIDSPRRAARRATAPIDIPEPAPLDTPAPVPTAVLTATSVPTLSPISATPSAPAPALAPTPEPAPTPALSPASAPAPEFPPVLAPPAPAVGGETPRAESRRARARMVPPPAIAGTVVTPMPTLTTLSAPAEPPVPVAPVREAVARISEPMPAPQRRARRLAMAEDPGARSASPAPTRRSLRQDRGY
ncbi:class Ib ribonucleoside-diphosphate reductase assembly flavoprotein NrdI [Mycetocola lacteus]|uniref:class Ib ribonucleoside-diphosphate reductase assembly flavoprotein NrdI n=1 Tax=Mycetocola lacteus TaxID=76637 RepID=UPI002482426A|nr:class Ib ribonucleoside-diphosphate reductase assembly flavoprotein NrdI [Mycetocola lacteus]